MQVFGHEVQPGTREDIAAFWTDGTHRRVIVDVGYAEAQAVLARILRRFSGGVGHYQHLRSKLGELERPGAVITAVLGPHRIGLMIPWLAGERGIEPYAVCREHACAPVSPVICASLADARSFARLASLSTGLSRPGWQAFQGESEEPDRAAFRTHHRWPRDSQKRTRGRAQRGTPPSSTCEASAAKSCLSLRRTSGTGRPRWLHDVGVVHRRSLSSEGAPSTMPRGSITERWGGP